MGFDALKKAVWQANMGLVENGLVLLTWGNASGADRDKGVVAIKPSGVDYAELGPEDIVVLSLESGDVLEGNLSPSSDTPSHLALYRAFDSIGGVIHTHSTYATSWAQACREIPCLGTTHADYAYGPVPLTRQLTAEEIETDYEVNTGKVIVERFKEGDLVPDQVPGVLVPCHGPFAWAADPMSALESAIMLEELARMALHTLALDPESKPIPQALLDKHFLRKHGPGAYYGQKKG